MMYLPGSYQQGFAPRDFEPRFPELWRGCVVSAAPCLGPSGTVLRDWSGRQYHGTLTNMVTNDDWVASHGRNALDFDGNNDFVSFGNLSVLSSTTNGSVCAWFFARNVSSFQAIVSDWNVGPSNAAFQLILRNVGSLGWQVVDGSNVNQEGMDGASAIATNRWYHVCAIKDGLTLKLFLDGREDATPVTCTNPGFGTSSADLRIGGRNLNGASDLLFNGLLDDLRIYNRALNQLEVRLLALRRGIAYEPRIPTYPKSQQSNRRRRLLTGMV